MASETEPVPGSAGIPHAFVDDINDPVLTSSDRRHLARVRRIRPDGLVTVSDGRGAWRLCLLGERTLETRGPRYVDAAVGPPITVGFALTKHTKPDLVVQKLTELGIDVIVPFLAERSIVRWEDAAAAKHVERWRRVASEASMQSGRCWLPEVRSVVAFDEVCEMPGVAGLDQGGGALSLRNPSLLVGPEGGWSAAERARLPVMVGLGPRVLRAETAAIAAGSVLTALRAGALA